MLAGVARKSPRCERRGVDGHNRYASSTQRAHGSDGAIVVRVAQDHRDPLDLRLPYRTFALASRRLDQGIGSRILNTWHESTYHQLYGSPLNPPPNKKAASKDPAWITASLITTAAGFVRAKFTTTSRFAKRRPTRTLMNTCSLPTSSPVHQTQSCRRMSLRDVEDSRHHDPTSRLQAAETKMMLRMARSRLQRP